MKPGVYAGLPMEEYLAIPAVSSGILEALLTQCPKAARHISWLNPNRKREESDEMDIGTIAHAILLEGSTEKLAIIDPKGYPTKSNGNIPVGWTNNEIRAARDSARARGKIPMLLNKVQPINDMVTAAMEYIEGLAQEPAVMLAFAPSGGESELTMVWDDNGVLCKARADRISSNRRLIVNYKTTGGSVEPESWGRRSLIDYYIGGAFYIRGAMACFGVEPEHIYLCQETAEPYLCSLVGMDPAWRSLGRARVATALKAWKLCAERGKFPGYPNRVCYPELPPWEEARAEAKALDPSIPYGSQA